MFHQTARGTFTAPVIPGTPHCGVDSSRCTCEYRVDLTYGNNALDHDGFLLDNTAFREYFLRFEQQPVSVSCENLCRQIAHDMCALCNDRATRVSVTLSPFAGVKVSYTHRPIVDAIVGRATAISGGVA